MTTTTTHRVIEATATREGKWWTITFPDLDTVTQARKVGEIQEMADDCAALWLDVDPDTIDVRVSIELPETFRTAWQEAQAKAAAARVDEAEAAALSRSVVRGLREAGYTYDDAALVLGLSKARVYQLAHDTKAGAAREVA